MDIRVVGKMFIWGLLGAKISVIKSKTKTKHLLCIGNL